MIRSTLKNNLLLSLIIINIGLILSLVLLDMNNIHINSIPTNYYEVKIILAGCMMTAGTIFFIYSLNRIRIENKASINSESSNHQDS